MGGYVGALGESVGRRVGPRVGGGVVGQTISTSQQQTHTNRSMSAGQQPASFKDEQSGHPTPNTPWVPARRTAAATTNLDGIMIMNNRKVCLPVMCNSVDGKRKRGKQWIYIYIW